MKFNMPFQSLSMQKTGTRQSMPTRIKPMLAVLVEEPFSSPDWYYEVKLDGVRAIAFIDKGSLRLISRNQKELTAQFPELKEVVNQIKAKQAILDGEIVTYDERGRTSFQKLQKRLGVTDKAALASLKQEVPVSYVVFDLLYVDGQDLRDEPLFKRRQLLARTVQPGNGLQIADYIAGHGTELFNLAKEKGFEGIIAKQRLSRYEERRSPNWKKIKAVLTQEFVIGGYTAPRGGRTYFGSLLLGVYENNSLVYVGHVGTGFDEATLAKVFQLMQPLRIAKCPFIKEPKPNEKPYWLKPELVAQVKFSQWTKDGYLRHPSFVGLRFDKEPQECRREIKKALPLPLTAAGIVEQEVEVEGKKLKLTHLNKLFWEEEGFTKRDLIEYYNLIADWLLPHLEDRPMVLKRYPDGIKGKHFFQKDAPAETPGWIKTKPIFETDHTNNYVLVNDKATLIYLINLACIDLNPWNSRVTSLDNPDWLLIDLDPFNAPFSQVVRVAKQCRQIFNFLGLNCYVKTSGATGLHLYAPLEPVYSYQQVRLLAEIVARLVVNKRPDLATIEHEISQRQGKVYVDYLQNVRGKTLASVYSVRPQPKAPVSTPLFWEELTEELNPLAFNLKTVVQRLEKLGDVFAPVLKEKQKLETALAKIESVGSS